MSVEGVHSIPGRGTVVTGRIDRGVIKINDPVEIVGFGDTQKSTVTGVEMFHKQMKQGEPGDNVGLLLRGVKHEEVKRGHVVAAPGTVSPHKKFKCELYVLTKDEGGRHTPFFSNYRPQFFINTSDVTGDIQLQAGTEMVMPGDNVRLDVELGSPIAIDVQSTFAIREGGKTIGAGVVSEILD